MSDATLVGGEHHVRRVEELNNHLDKKIGAGRRQRDEHHGLGHHELLPLGAPGRKEPRGRREVRLGCDALAVSNCRRR